MKYINQHEIRSALNSIKTLSAFDFKILLQEINTLSDNNKVDLMQLTDRIHEKLCYDREVADSKTEIKEWQRLTRRLNKVEKIIAPAYDRWMEAEASKSKWDILNEMDTNILIHYRDTVLNKKSNTLSDEERLEESIYIAKLLHERSL